MDSLLSLMGLLKYDKSSLFHSIRLYVSYLYLQIKHDKTPDSTTTRQLDWLTREGGHITLQLDWLTTVQEKYCDVSQSSRGVVCHNFGTLAAICLKQRYSDLS